MKLVGAKLSTIKLPIIFNIILVGLLSGAISILISFSVISYFNIEYNLLLKMTGFDFRLFIVLILLIGPFIGSIVTTVALRKISLRV